MPKVTATDTMHFGVAAEQPRVRNRRGPRGCVDLGLAQLNVDPTVRSVGADSICWSHQFLNSCRDCAARFLIEHPPTVEITNVVVGLGDRVCITAVTAGGTEEVEQRRGDRDHRPVDLSGLAVRDPDDRAP